MLKSSETQELQRRQGAMTHATWFLKNLEHCYCTNDQAIRRKAFFWGQRNSLEAAEWQNNRKSRCGGHRPSSDVVAHQCAAERG